MKKETADKLERLKNHATRYEVVIERGEERYRVAYAMRKSGRGLRDIIRTYLHEIRTFTGLHAESPMFHTDQCDDRGIPAGAMTIGSTQTTAGWIIRYSGRTQREAVSTETELTWLKDAPPPTEGQVR